MLVTYNGDHFDLPYLDVRCQKYRINLYNMVGVRSNKPTSNRLPSARAGDDEQEDSERRGGAGGGAGTTSEAAAQQSMAMSDLEYTGRCMVHMDAFAWVQRDSYLPQGSAIH